MSAEFLEQHVKALIAFARETEEQLAKDPHDFWCAAALKVQYQAIAKAWHELAVARAAQTRQSCELRLIAPPTKAQGWSST
ncbi:hypothetical protein K6V71_06270 [Cupriavidus gilardii]|uniref:hypothetical protein n=1 Tax=Cupriavidus gilardii TaxID=82541 RepID=UPI0021B21020|nr:hypothetical protein [Cupriavidus gilardii]UXC38332.1 hypothetical protein N4G38_25055 [Cupriavidus gilardii]